MTTYETGDNFGQELCRILGIDSQSVTRLTLTVQASELVTIEAVMRVEQGSEIIELLKQYSIVELEQDVTNVP